MKSKDATRKLWKEILMTIALVVIPSIPFVGGASTSGTPTRRPSSFVIEEVVQPIPPPALVEVQDSSVRVVKMKSYYLRSCQERKG